MVSGRITLRDITPLPQGEVERGDSRDRVRGYAAGD
jgi:hypothetical protein